MLTDQERRNLRNGHIQFNRFRRETQAVAMEEYRLKIVGEVCKSADKTVKPEPPTEET